MSIIRDVKKRLKCNNFLLVFFGFQYVYSENLIDFFGSRQGGEIQTRVGLLLLLCSWLSNCSLAVAHFLNNPANIPYVSFECFINRHTSEEKTRYEWH